MLCRAAGAQGGRMDGIVNGRIAKVRLSPASAICWPVTSSEIGASFDGPVSSVTFSGVTPSLKLTLKSRVAVLSLTVIATSDLSDIAAFENGAAHAPLSV